MEDAVTGMALGEPEIRRQIEALKLHGGSSRSILRCGAANRSNS
jgi:hypothetical protein